MNHLVPNDFCAYRKVVRDLVPYPCLHSSLLKQKRELWGWLLLFLSPSSRVAPWVQTFHRRVIQHVGELDEFLQKFEVTEQFPEVYQNSRLTSEELLQVHEWIVGEYQEILELISYGASSPAPENLHFFLSRGRWRAEEIHHSSHHRPFPISLSSNLFFCGTRKDSPVPWVWCCSIQEILESLSRSSPALNPRTGERLGSEVETQLRSRYNIELKVLSWGRDAL